ncbi:acid phosphatase type 7-like [Mizuhopecten yessoensis]|uniref:Purple acid phosphatase n=1 Tax=Mizuhopecten yessoensis TaxID=6573 RepID=A0A210PFC2_MIZYE|nr:acid phosphatase type 7-like [Mizuhopecten yessoensis]OWF35193.1 Iron/zinc purple acid phosphatase-like protein [Mizuhopecten yessoensis]
MGNQTIWTMLLSCTLIPVIAKISQIHLSFGSTSDVMKVMWSTPNDVMCYVEYWAPGKEHIHVRASQSELLADNRNAMRFIHMADMLGLLPGQNHTYKIICASETSDELIFTTQPREHDRLVKFIVYGDMGYKYGQKTIEVLKTEVTSEHYDAIWHVGDISYNLESDGGAVGDTFMELIQPLAAHIPYMTSPGNHELTNGLHHYRTRFSMPGVDWPMPLDRLWYSYNVGPVHFISFSSEVYFIDNANYVCQQFHWLLDDLTKANQNRDKQPWIVAMGHRPMYCSNGDADDCTGRIFGYLVKNGLEDLFYAQGVDLILQAHEHSYERLWPVYKNKVVAKNYNNPQAPVHIISGAAGSGEGADHMGRRGPWSAFASAEGSINSFGRLLVYNSSHLYFEQVKVKDGRSMDSVWVVKSLHGPNVPYLNCSSTHAHQSCRCPPPFHYLTLIIVAVVLFIVLSVGIYCCCKWKKKKMPICFKPCCPDPHPFHQRLFNIDNEDEINV